MAAVRKTREQIAAERAAELKAFENYKKTRLSKGAIARPTPRSPAKPGTAAERAARTKAMEAKKAAPRPPAYPRKPVTPSPLRGPAAIKEIQRQVSPQGIKKTESGAKKAIDKKYPGLYKK